MCSIPGTQRAPRAHRMGLTARLADRLIGAVSRQTWVLAHAPCILQPRVLDHLRTLISRVGQIRIELESALRGSSWRRRLPAVLEEACLLVTLDAAPVYLLSLSVCRGGLISCPFPSGSVPDRAWLLRPGDTTQHDTRARGRETQRLCINLLFSPVQRPGRLTHLLLLLQNDHLVNADADRPSLIQNTNDLPNQ
jgi:hypothetical protein